MLGVLLVSVSTSTVLFTCYDNSDSFRGQCNSGHCPCSMYAPGFSNHRNCNTGQGQDVYQTNKRAYEVCPECGNCTRQVPCIGNSRLFTTYSGNCSAYGTDEQRHAFCDDDGYWAGPGVSNTSLKANLVCPECGDCYATERDPCLGDYASWETSVGGDKCTAYNNIQTAQNNCASAVDRDNSTLTARLSCPECGECERPIIPCQGNYSQWVTRYGMLYNCSQLHSIGGGLTQADLCAKTDVNNGLTARLACPECLHCTLVDDTPTDNDDQNYVYNGTFVPNQTTCMDIHKTHGVGGIFSWSFGYSASYRMCLNSTGHVVGLSNFAPGNPWWYPNDQYPLLRPGECPEFALPGTCDDTTSSSDRNQGWTCTSWQGALADYTNCEEYLADNWRYNNWEDLCDASLRYKGFWLKPPGDVVGWTGLGTGRKYQVREFCSQCQSTSHGGCVAGPPFRPHPPPTPAPPTSPPPTPPPMPPTPAPTYTLPPTQVAGISVLGRKANANDILNTERTITASFDILFSSINATAFAQEYVDRMSDAVARPIQYEYVQVFPLSPLSSRRRRDNHNDVTGCLVLLDTAENKKVELETAVAVGIFSVQNKVAQPLDLSAILPPSPPPTIPPPTPLNDDETGDGDGGGGGDSSNTAVIAGAAGGGGALLLVVGLLVYYRKDIFTTRGRLGGTGSGTGSEALERLM